MWGIGKPSRGISGVSEAQPGVGMQTPVKPLKIKDQSHGLPVIAGSGILYP